MQLNSDGWKRMGRRGLICLALGAAVMAVYADVNKDQQRLVTGEDIEPATGFTQDVGSLPENIAVTPDGKYAVTTDMGFNESLWSLRTSDGIGVSHLEFKNNKQNGPRGLYWGLAFGDSHTVYAAEGANDAIAVVSIADDGTLTEQDPIHTRKNDFPAGLALDNRGYLYVTNNDSGDFHFPSSVAIYDLKSHSEVGRYTYTGPPCFPLAIATLSDGSLTYVANERDGVVDVLNTSDPKLPMLKTSIATGAHPDAMVLDKAQARLFVANAQSDTVSVIDTSKNVVTKTIMLAPLNIRTPVTATPTGLTLSPDEKTLYVALADMNAIGVVDPVKGVALGYIPTGWYPSAVASIGTKLMITNAKGTVSQHPNPEHTLGEGDHYILNLIVGNVLTIDAPDSAALKVYTAKVMENNREVVGKPFKIGSKEDIANLVSLGMPLGIEHVIYIVKENRTYDQLFGDIAEGNGDPSLAIFGKDVTPNQHALAERFLLLDNFYDCGEVSGDGWPWSTGSMANDYVIRNVPYSYGGRGRQYDYEGQNNGYPAGGFAATDPNGNPNSALYPKGAPPIPDITEARGGHLWDLARAADLTYRNYGFFYTFGDSDIPDNYPTAKGLLPPGHDLEGISDYDYRRFDNDYPDSDAPELAYEHTKDPNCLTSETSYGIHHAQSRVAEWRTEFLKEITDDPFGGEVPALTTIRLPRDHTQGLDPGKHSPRSEVADNDYAVGEVVQAVSQSYTWKSTAIFVIEDDSQDGPDHVDCHRSICLVISPLIAAHTVDHSFYNTDSVLRTIEALLHLPPMTAYDATAPLIQDFQPEPVNDDAYHSILEDDAIMAEVNPQKSALRPGSVAYHLADLSSRLDFKHPDSAPAALVNDMIWKSVKGMDATVPPARHRKDLHIIPQPDADGDGDGDSD